MFQLLRLALLVSCFLLCKTTLVGYDIEEVLTTKIYSLLPREQCTPASLKSEVVSWGGLVLHAPEVDIELSFCMFSASYVLTQTAHSARFDDSTYVSEYSRLIPTFYDLDTWTCRSIWSQKEFVLPGFGNQKFRLTKEDIHFNGLPFQSGDQKRFDYNWRFMHGGSKAGIYFTWPVDWISPSGVQYRASGVINAQLTIGRTTGTLDKSRSPWSLLIHDPHGQTTSSVFPGADFVYDSVAYLPHFHGQCEIKSVFMFSNDQPGQLISSTEATYLSGTMGNGTESRIFYIELLNTTVSVCSYNVRPTTYSGVYFIVDPVTDKFPPVDFNKDAVPNLVYGTKIEFVHVNAHISRQKIVNFIKTEICNTRQLILNGLISLASNLDNPNLFLGSGSMIGVHAEKAGAVLYVHKCAKVAVHIADFPYCTEEIPVMLDNSTVIKFMNPITQVVYPNYTLTACDPIAPYMYRTSEGVWMHYGSDHTMARPPESLSVFSQADFVDTVPSLHTAGLFSYQNLRQSAKARVLKYSRRTIAGREVYLGPGNFYTHPGLVHYNSDISSQLETLPNWKFVEDLKSSASSGWLYAERCTVRMLTVFALLGLLVYVMKIFYALRLASRGVSPRRIISLLNPFAPFARAFVRHKQGLDLALAASPEPKAPKIATVEAHTSPIGLQERTFTVPIYPQT